MKMHDNNNAVVLTGCQVQLHVCFLCLDVFIERIPSKAPSEVDVLLGARRLNVM